MNRVYEIGEGRPIWKLRPVTQAVGNALGLGSAAVLAWQIAKWPALLLIVVVIVALLYWATPNVKQPKFRWLSIGAFVAIIVWVLASAAFGFYVANFSGYNKTYGALAGVIVFLLWLWSTNLALLFRNIDKTEAKRQKDVASGRELRQRHGRDNGQDHDETRTSR